VLPQVKNKEYVEFYKERRAAGDLLILDNGVYEGETNYSKTLEMIPVYKPQVVVLPDKMLAPWNENFSQAFSFLRGEGRQYTQEFGIQWMFVPQAPKGDMMGFLDGTLAAIDKLEVQWIAIPRVLPLVISNDPLSRVNLCHYLKKINPDLKVHCLGMAAGNVGELPLLQQAGCDSIDSSAPVWRGWNNYSLAGTSGRSPVSDCDFNAPSDPIPGGVIDELILKNLEACGVNCNSARNVNPPQGQAVSSSTGD
jgi:hypothetical protein